LEKISLDAFWRALPSLRDVMIHVSPDWRTVDKDDAGFAETTNICPSDAVRPFFNLLRRLTVIQSVKRLDIGWIGGGEHGQGICARNNNLLPAPLCPPERSTANHTGFGLVFKHLEELTLTNCWITPPALEGLVKSHENLTLKRLILDSVSLTAHPKFPPAAGAQQALQQQIVALQAQNQAVAAMHPAGHLIAAPLAPPPAQGQINPQQWVQMQQQMLQQQMQQLQQMLAAPPAPANPGPLGAPPLGALNANMNGNTNANNNQTPNWTVGHREGSWPELINTISPGSVFDDHLPPPPPWEPQPPARPVTTLQSIEFRSCGYARLLHSTTFDQLVLETAGLPIGPTMSNWFRMRQAALKPAMLETRDRLIGQIVQFMPQRELDALQMAWSLREGWEDRAKAEEVEYDGYAPGGTGRFTGVIQRGG
jgi:hypothetical protein